MISGYAALELTAKLGYQRAFTVKPVVPFLTVPIDYIYDVC